MLENNESKKLISNNHTNDDLSQESSQDILGKDITSIAHYNIRNRKFDSANPFYITKGKNFRLGILSVNTPGNNREEQLIFVTNILKLPKDSKLIQFEFWKGNSWITIGFDYEEDLIFCKDKLNSKEKDMLNLIQLSMNKGKGKMQQITDNNNFSKKQQPSQSSPNPIPIKNQQNSHITKPIHKNIKTTSQESSNNPFDITEKTTSFQGNFLLAKVSGENKKEQLNHISKILKICPDSNLITPLFHEGNS